jgi:hypothetical protein
MCADKWTSNEEPNGECPECGAPTHDGKAVWGCCYSYEECKTCGHTFCDGGC